MKQKFGGLDLLRGCAAMMVMFWHVPGVEGRFLTSGGLAVDLFFLISGFIVAHAYERGLQTGAMSVGRFFKTRMIRLYPLYAIGSALGLAAVLFSIWTTGFALWKVRPIVPNTALAIFMLPRPADARTASFLLNDPAWSLFFEVLINVAYAVAAPRLSARRLISVVVAALCCLLALQIKYGRFDFGDASWIMFLALPRVVFSYGLGCLIYRRWIEGRLPRCQVRAWLLPPTFLFLIWLPAQIYPPSVTQLISVTILFPAMLVAAVQSEPSGKWALAASAGADLSYPLYMVHYPLVVFTYAGVQRGLWKADVAYPLCIIATTGLSVAVDRLYDRPVRKWLARRYLGRSRQNVADNPAFP